LGGFLDGWLLSAVPTLAPPDNANNAHATYYIPQRSSKYTHTSILCTEQKCIFYNTTASILCGSIYFLPTCSPAAAFVINSEHRPKKKPCSARHRSSCQSFFMRHANIDSPRALCGAQSVTRIHFNAAPCNLALFAVRLQ
jgi:hypothetical protein